MIRRLRDMTFDERAVAHAQTIPAPADPGDRDRRRAAELAASVEKGEASIAAKRARRIEAARYGPRLAALFEMGYHAIQLTARDGTLADVRRALAADSTYQALGRHGQAWWDEVVEDMYNEIVENGTAVPQIRALAERMAAAGGEWIPPAPAAEDNDPAALASLIPR